MNLSLSQSDQVPLDWLDEDTIRVLREIAAGIDPADRHIDLVVVDDRYIQQINRDFRGKDRPTDVISFSYLGDDTPGASEDAVGEIYVSHETLAREADEIGVGVRPLFLRLGVHGLLHVVGFDHEDETDAVAMEREERDLLTGYLDAVVLDKMF